jgi:hypothetical protein
MEEVKSYVPTNDELVGIIKKIAEFIKAFFVLFDQLKKGLAETFGKYTPVYPDATGSDAEAV